MASILQAGASLSLVFLVATSGAATAQQISVTTATVEGGRFVVEGTTPLPNQKITLDDRFNATSLRSRTFRFSFGDYLPADCIVALKAGALATTALVSNCGPRGVTPRGPWNGEDDYVAGDVVGFGGSSWRAKRDNTGRPPSNGKDWALFARAGDGGATGPTGPQGPIGPAGTTGPQGEPGPQGALGVTGPQGGLGQTGRRGVVKTWQITGTPRETSGFGNYIYLFTPGYQTITVGPGQKVFAMSSMSARRIVDSGQHGAVWAICYRSGPSDSMKPRGVLFSWFGLTTQNNAITATAVVDTGPGTWDVGPCLAVEQTGKLEYNSLSTTTLMLINGG
jgi:hypothetical protein